MPRYQARRPRATHLPVGEEYSHIPNLEVDYVETNTGLLDAQGNEIWRLPNPIGFVWEDT